MDFQFLLLTISLSSVVLIAAIVNMMKSGPNPVKPSYDVVVGVLSAADNYEHRDAIRLGWGSFTKNKTNPMNNRVLLKFIVGEYWCDVPPELRLSEYSCEQKPHSCDEGPFPDSSISFKSVAPVRTQLVQTTVVGYEFLVLGAVTVDQLGIVPAFFTKDVTVYLVDVRTMAVVTSMRFSPESPGLLMNGYYMKHIATFILPQDFRGCVIVRNTENHEPGDKYTAYTSLFQTHDNSIEYLTVYEQGFSLTSGLAGFPTQIDAHTVYNIPVIFTYQIHQGPNQWAERSVSCDDKKRDWLDYTHRQSELLNSEMVTHNDITLVPVVDVYRNLPSKLLHFYKWLSDNYDYKLMLKTDDDCYLKLTDIMAAIDDFSVLHKTNIWWGNFRVNWAVDVYGKWAELDYRAIVYPPFTCGSGYILSHDLTGWLVGNMDHLKQYQGEDVSHGIWLTAVGPTPLNSPLWLCTSCIGDGVYNELYYSCPELSPEQLIKIWQDESVT